MEEDEILENSRVKTAKDVENELINLSINKARELIQSKKPPVQLLLHFLKLATEKTMLEREKLRHENTLIAAKTKSIKDSSNMPELVNRAIAAMTEYEIPQDEYYDEEL